VETAPDLMLSWWDDDSFTIRPTSHALQNKVVRRLDEKYDKLLNWSGTHRLQGIFLFKGKPFQTIHIETAPHIVDLAPTLLYLLDCPIPKDMDGKVIEEAFKKDYLQAHAATYHDGDSSGPENGTPSNDTYSDQESEQVEKKLRALGYME
jgi:hypothetical protein